MQHTQGSVIWITGLSGAGKTTIGKAVHDTLAGRGERTVFLDGDEMRAVFDGGHKFDRESRLALALSYGRLCLMLARQGFTVVCATISMHREVYAWNRAHLPGYAEVFLDVSADVRSGRDPKRFYAKVKDGALSDFAGHNQEVDLPAAPHVHIRPSPGETIQETVGRVMAGLDAARIAPKAEAG